MSKNLNKRSLLIIKAELVWIEEIKKSKIAYSQINPFNILRFYEDVIRNIQKSC